MVNPRFIPPEAPTVEVAHRHETDYPGPFFLFGKALNALLLDRIDADIDRLQRINFILEAGVRRYGPDFVAEINKDLGDQGRIRGLKRLRIVHIRASQDIGAMAAAFARSPEFGKRASGMIGRLIRRISEWEGAGEADLSRTSFSTASFRRVSSSSERATPVRGTPSFVHSSTSSRLPTQSDQSWIDSAAIGVTLGIGGLTQSEQIVFSNCSCGRRRSGYSRCSL